MFSPVWSCDSTGENAVTNTRSWSVEAAADGGRREGCGRVVGGDPPPSPVVLEWLGARPSSLIYTPSFGPPPTHLHPPKCLCHDLRHVYTLVRALAYMLAPGGGALYSTTCALFQSFYYPLTPVHTPSRAHPHAPILVSTYCTYTPTTPSAKYRYPPTSYPQPPTLYTVYSQLTHSLQHIHTSLQPLLPTHVHP